MGAKESGTIPRRADFGIAFRGFRRRQLLDRVDRLEEELRRADPDRGSALARVADLRELLEATRPDRADAGTPAPEVAAQVAAQVAELRRELVREAVELREAAARRTAELDRREAELARRQREQERRLRAHADRVRGQVDRVLRETAERCRHLEEESRSRREHEREAFERTMIRRRAETVRRLAEQEELTRVRAAFVVEVAARRARRHIAEARLAAAQLRRLRAGGVAPEAPAPITGLVDQRVGA
ncbi:DNA repair exonuclease SbcCD ATPase subunit [Saccharothrix coeruleofusca]|uniref:hypothetical protein n=1 Tax=Saccharothrix coeruleofusca TaxID=33919 RepID=UPI001AE1B76F|nr:hypothetical protein [Saccharothrix coeruleofusca]MBP2338674.1 DNA repair exonuclease SbcCD ATPase subunit [Saccharothrix coeruleofusca]